MMRYNILIKYNILMRHKNEEELHIEDVEVDDEDNDLDKKEMNYDIA